jgi:hypothetical protein
MLHPGAWWPLDPASDHVSAHLSTVAVAEGAAQADGHWAGDGNDVGSGLAVLMQPRYA